MCMVSRYVLINQSIIQTNQSITQLNNRTHRIDNATLAMLFVIAKVRKDEVALFHKWTHELNNELHDVFADKLKVCLRHRRPSLTSTGSSHGRGARLGGGHSRGSGKYTVHGGCMGACLHLYVRLNQRVATVSLLVIWYPNQYWYCRTRRLSLILCGCFCPALATAGAFGLLSVCQIQYQPIVFASIILIMAVGVDDVFIVMRIWSIERKNREFSEKLMVLL